MLAFLTEINAASSSHLASMKVAVDAHIMQVMGVGMQKRHSCLPLHCDKCLETENDTDMMNVKVAVLVLQGL